MTKMNPEAKAKIVEALRRRERSSLHNDNGATFEQLADAIEEQL